MQDDGGGVRRLVAGQEITGNGHEIFDRTCALVRWAGCSSEPLTIPRLEITHLKAAIKHFLKIPSGNRCGQC